MSSMYIDKENGSGNSDGPSTSKKNRLSDGNTSSQEKKNNRDEWNFIPIHFIHNPLHNEYSCWLGPDPRNSTRAICKWCNSSALARDDVIEQHENTHEHLRESRYHETNPLYAKQQYLKLQTASDSLSIKSAEIKICGFMAAHNIPFAVVDDMILCLKSALPDSEILDRVQLKRMKATKIVTDVIGASQKDDIASQLRNTKFSILTDVSTDGAYVKTACIVVRYYDQKTGRITSKFWDLSSVFPKGDAEVAEEGAADRHLYDILIQTFTERNIPLENIIAFGCDGANVNPDDHNSIASRLKESCPGITIMKCICHSLHLVASAACEANMPRRCKDLARNVHNYVQHNGKQIAGLKVFQSFLNVPVHKILHPAQTRWLSLLSIVNRMLEQWEPLCTYFVEIHPLERTLAAESTSNWLRNPFIKLYYLFLSWILSKVVSMNELFQSDSVIVTFLAQKMEILFSELLTSYLKREYVARTPLGQINPRNHRMFLPIENMYLGEPVSEELKKPEVVNKPDDINEFFYRCRDFLVQFCTEIQKIFNFDDPLLKLLPLLHPSKALRPDRFQSLARSLSDYIPRAKPKDPISLQKLDDEWRRLPLDDIPAEIVKETAVDVFWHKISLLKDSENCSRYVELPRFALAVLCIPHSNADCQRAFSKYNLVKTETKNRLTIKNIEGAMLAAQCVKSSKNCCAGFEPKQDMLDRMTSAISYIDKQLGAKEE